METVIIKAISEAGMGLGSLLILGGILIYTMKMLSKNIQANTDMTRVNIEVTRELMAEIRAGREVDKSVLTAIEFCKAHNKNI